MCPQYGTSYLPKDTATEENFEPTASPKSQTKIIQAKKKQKKQVDSQGNEINDEQLLKDIARGVKVISYREDKVEGDPKNPKRHVVRK